MKLKWLLSLVLVFGLTGLATAQPLTKTQRLPIWKDARDAAVSLWGKYKRGIAVVGTSALLVCGPMGCGGDDVDEIETVAEQTVAEEETEGEEILEDPPYTLVDYLGKYVAFVGGGDGAIVTGYVTNVFSHLNKLEIIPDENLERGWGLEQEIRLLEVIGVMHHAHPLINEEVSFKNIAGAFQWRDRGILPNKIYGTVDVVYVEAVMPEGSGEPTVYGVTVHTGQFGFRQLPLQIEETVFIPANRVEFVETAEE